MLIASITFITTITLLIVSQLKKWSQFIWILIIFVVVEAFYCREYGIRFNLYAGDDAPSYYSKLLLIQNENLNFDEKFLLRLGFLEPIYIAFLVVFNTIFGDIEKLFYWISYFLPILITMLALKKKFENYAVPVYVILLFAFDFYSYQTFHLFRQSLSFAFVTMYFCSSSSKRHWLLVIAGLIHFSALIFVLIEVISKLRGLKKWAILLICLLLLLSAESRLPVQYLVHRSNSSLQLLFTLILGFYLIRRRSFSSDLNYKVLVGLFIFIIAIAEYKEVSSRYLSYMFPLLLIDVLAKIFSSRNGKFMVLLLGVFVVMIYPIILPKGILTYTGFKWFLYR